MHRSPLPETVRSFWHGGPLPTLARACLRSFVRHGHTVEVYAYHPLEVPAGVRIRPAEEILPASDLKLFDSVQSFADLFRYELLHAQGGWWVDTDVYCLKPTLPGAARAWAAEESGLLNNAILRFPPKDPACARLCRLARERGSVPHRWGAIGPKLVTEILEGSPDGDHGGSTAAFYPLHWMEAHYAWLPERRAELESRLAGAVFLHLWMKALTMFGIELDRAPPSGSWLEMACAGERWPRRNFPWSDWRIRRSISRYHDTEWARSRLARAVEGRA